MATVIPCALLEVTETQKILAGKRKRSETKSRKSFPCQLCGKIFTSVEKLKVHSYSHTGERPYKCSHGDCTKAFVSKYKLLRHMATHSPQKIHKCTYCEKMFHRKDHLKNHLQTHDPNKEAFKCEECGKNYNTKLGYKRHLALHAATSGDLTCRVCLQTFESTGVLLEHLKTHAGKSSSGTKEKKHQCDHCDRCFYTRKDVRRHMVVHTGRKDFLCQYCAQRFGRKDHLTRHMKKSHSQELLKVKTEPTDFINLLSSNTSLSLKDELSPVMSVVSSELTTRSFTNTLQMNIYSAHIQTMQTLGANNQMISTPLPLGMGCPLEIETSICSPQELSSKYFLGSTSYAIALPEKGQPLKSEIDSFLMDLHSDLLPSAHDTQLSSSKQGMESQPGSLGDGSGDILLSKSPAFVNEPLNTSSLDFSQLLSFLPLNNSSYNQPVSLGNSGMCYTQEEPPSSLIPLPPLYQDSHETGNSIGLNALHPLSTVFTTSLSTTTLPRFHQAFQ
ncbi:zinc finger protein PLAG1 isoform X1 [Leucoraja erinacea]|uniref:zinc finger protein PLAG1 isoform X1 n=2 Tax=Leucoraja erinaceus TaxID=7782 RepID=UPI002454C5F7|nr:zinc finger protein PLAG1 isoform X1 [Leucoraja erinacea]XP_055490019.1 zinc finger protein PLAG1 isoform X1 [Leucoraja erinacea]